MKKTRWGLLALLVLAIATVVGGYHASRKRMRLLAPVRPAPLPAELQSLSKNWSWSRSEGDRPVVEARARDFRQIKEGARFELTEVELKIFSRSGDAYDLVRSQKAEFDPAAERLHSLGPVTLLLGVPAASPSPAKGRVEIRTAGLTYDNKTGITSTDQPVRFQFEQGEGASTGAQYDPARRYLWMKSQVEVSGLPSLSGATSGPEPRRAARPMRLRAGELHYYEAEQKIEMRPWSSLERGDQGIQAADATVWLEQGALKKVGANRAEGWNLGPGREVRFGGDRLEAHFTPEGAIASAAGQGNARLVSRAAAGLTRVTGGRVDLEFQTRPGTEEIELTTARVREQARMESGPETRVLAAEELKLVMRPGGEEVETVETLGAGRLELAPSQPGQWKRTLTADRISARYARGNRVEQLRASGQAHLRSDPPAAEAERRGARPQPRQSWSDNLDAVFDPASGQMRELRQWSNFRYQEGPRQAKAAGAKFELAEDRITLESEARVWDESGSTSADLLVLEQRQDRFRAEGNVTSTHRERAGSSSGSLPAQAWFSPGQPVHAASVRFHSDQRNRLLRYRGAARLWQPGNSLQAEEIDLDRTGRTLSARGGVVSILTEQDDRRNLRPRVVTISADSLEYWDEGRRALYSGGVLLRRDSLTVRSAELEAFLRPAEAAGNGQSRLERALARGQVEIVETAAAGSSPRRGRAEQAEFFSADQKVILRGGSPTLEQPDRGSTRGEELTYYLDQERLLVSGGPGAPSQGRQKLKRK